MKTNLQLGTGEASSKPASTNVFEVITSALDTAGRRLGCWDSTRFTDGQRRDVMPDPTVTHDTLAYAFATS